MEVTADVPSLDSIDCETPLELDSSVEQVLEKNLEIRQFIALQATQPQPSSVEISNVIGM